MSFHSGRADVVGYPEVRLCPFRTEDLLCSHPEHPHPDEAKCRVCFFNILWIYRRSHRSATASELTDGAMALWKAVDAAGA